MREQWSLLRLPSRSLSYATLNYIFFDMKALVTFLLLWVMALPTCATGILYKKTDSVRVERIIKKASAIKSRSDVIVFIGKQLVGTPYVAHTLEQGEERLVINTSELDCTTFVENVLAMYLCVKNGKHRFADFCDYIRQVRYDKGMVSYPSRLHYFTSWIASNTDKGLVEEVSTPTPPFSATQTISVGYMSANPDKYDALRGNSQMVRVIAATEKSINGRRYKYIPKQRLNDSRLLAKYVRSGDIIALTTNKKGLDISHVGYAVWMNGSLHLMNASSIHHKVVIEPMTMYQYAKRHPSQTGIRVIRVL